MMKFIKSQPVLFISFIAAVITMFIIPPDKSYAEYINRTVLIQLFALMAAVAGFRSVGIFEKITGFMLEKAATVRTLAVILILLCFFSSMLVTNDVALLTFVPLTVLIFKDIKDEKSLIFTIVLETVAANMGSMLTPVGNPQNLFAYDEYKISALDFISATLPVCLASGIITLALALIIPKNPCSSQQKKETVIPKVPTTAFSVLFIICLLTVFRVIPDYVCFICAVAVMLIFDRKVFAKIDYSLLATFVCFFIFVGNIGKIEPVKNFFSEIISGREVVVTALLSQVISNVPATVMLSGFTENGLQMVLGADIGGLGTLIASLASLISFQIYRKSDGAKPMKYLVVFSAVNFGMLIPMILLQIFVFAK